MKNDENLINEIKNLVKEVSYGKEKEIKIYESRLSRIWKYVEDKSASFGVISPYRKTNSPENNLYRYKELKNFISNKLKLGYIELDGGFKEEGEWVYEKSLFIPNIKKEDLIFLGGYYDQYSVIYKDSNEFNEIGTNDASGIGAIINNFEKNAWDNNIQINTKTTKDLFSRLIKESHRDRKFLFNMTESFLFELDSKTFNDMYREVNGKGEKRFIRLV